MEDYNVISYHGHDIRVKQYEDINRIAFETSLYQMKTSTPIRRTYELNYANYTDYELSLKIEGLMDKFLQEVESYK